MSVKISGNIFNIKTTNNLVLINKYVPDEIYELINLESLFINDCIMNYISPKIKNLIKLKSITISFCQITEIPDEIGYLTNIKYLNLGNNEISRITPNIKNLTRLENLILQHNQITEIPPVLMFRKLKFLDIFSNQITKIPKDISKVECKLELGINHNKIQFLPNEAFEIMKESNIDDTAYDINNLDINCEILIFNNLQQDLTNLPVLLKRIYFKKDLREKIEKYIIKIPFDCEKIFF